MAERKVTKLGTGEMSLVEDQGTKSRFLVFTMEAKTFVFQDIGSDENPLWVNRVQFKEKLDPTAAIGRYLGEPPKP